MSARGSKTVQLLVAALVGAAVQYMFDPAQGRTRRARARDKVTARRNRARRAAEQAQQTAQMAQDRASGRVYEATRPAGADMPANDPELVDKVRSEVLGEDAWRPYTINVDAAGGVVTLRGQVDRPEQIRELERRVGGVTGVVRVENLLHLPGTTPENIREAEEASLRRASEEVSRGRVIE